MKKCVVVMLALMVGFAFAEEFPYIPGSTHNIPGTAPIKLDQTELKPTLINEPVWKTLERMIQTERENSEIQLVLEKDATDEALHMAYRIENVWNSGEFENALALFPELAELTDINEMAIGNAWRTPVPTQEQPDWGADVRIGNRDSLYICALDRHNSTGNLFAIILLRGDGNTCRWNVNFSTNGGQTWSETYDWWANYDLNSLDAAVVANHCYVGFGRGSSQDQGFLYRFKVTDGTQENFPNASPYVTVFTTTSPDAIEEVALWSNHDQFDNRIYYSAIINDGEVRALWDDPDAITWTEYTTNIANAERGLDAGWNQDFADRYHWLSYISSNDSVHIHSVELGTWSQRIRYAVGTITDYTSVGAYHDTIIVFFDYHGASGVYVRYLRTYNAGTTWAWGFVDDTTTTQESPDVTARRGGGQGVVYRFYTSPRELRYAWRNYSGGWATPVIAAETEPYYNKPSIEYLDGGVHGVVFLSWTSPHYHAAYFTRSDWTGIVENKSKDLTSHLVSLAPNPSRNLAKLSYTLKKEGNVKISLYDVTGRSVDNLVNEAKTAGKHTITIDTKNRTTGIYFLKVETPEATYTKQMTIIK
ncbi:T9SS type A sorting domain-containing protein [candidate division WOR-3 bacterium]|nr:T9SS type A sorting domain-containing protein [candidate division WOR-3 bacterium]